MLLLLYNPKRLPSIYYKTIYHFKTISSRFFKNLIIFRIQYIIFSSYQVHEIPYEFSSPVTGIQSTSTTPIILSEKKRSLLSML